MELEGKKAEVEKAKLELELAKMREGKPSAKSTFKAVIKHDALGLKTKLAEAMKQCNLGGRIERTHRPDDSGEYDTVIIFTGTPTNTNEMKERLEKDSQHEVNITSQSFKQFNTILISPTQEGHHRSNSSGGKETLWELDPDHSTLASTQKSEGSRTSSKNRNTAMQKEFRDAIIERDFNGDKSKATCLLCGAGCESEVDFNACHIVPQCSTLEVMRSVGLTSLFNPKNGLLLCKTCHTHQGDGLWNIGQDGQPLISEALMQVDKYRQISDKRKSLEVPTGSDAPTELIWKFHTDLCAKKKKERNGEAEAKNHQCEKCGNFLTTESRLVKHQANCSGEFKKKLYTPQKGANNDGGDSSNEKGELADATD
jgi:hypothetical protein